MYRLVTEKAVHGRRLHQEDHNHEAGCQPKLNYPLHVNRPRLMLAKKEHTHTHDTEPLSTFKVMPRKRRKESVKILVVTGPGRGGKLLKDILTSGGYDVEALSDGNEGLELCKKNNFTLVFTELEIGGISAWQLAEGVKKLNQDIPVILITGWKAQPDEPAMQKSHIDVVVNKPFSFNQVLTLVKELTHEV